MRAPIRVIVLSNHTLLVEGVIARLKQHRDRVELHVVDLEQSNLLSYITEVQPNAIILDDQVLADSQLVPLDELFRIGSNIKVIRLNKERLQVQMIRSEQYCVAEVRDLLELIEPAGT